MATEIWLQRRLGHLVPANAQSAELLAALPADKWMLATIRMPRNVKHHRKYWALLQAVFPHQTTWPTMKSFHRQIKKAMGFGEWVEAENGKKEFIEDSISFASMDQTEFEQLYARLVELILTKVLPNVNSEDLEREVQDILRGRGGEESEAAETEGAEGSEPAPETPSVREPASPAKPPPLTAGQAAVLTEDQAVEYAHQWADYFASLQGREAEDAFCTETSHLGPIFREHFDRAYRLMRAAVFAEKKDAA